MALALFHGGQELKVSPIQSSVTAALLHLQSRRDKTFYSQTQLGSLNEDQQVVGTATRNTDIYIHIYIYTYIYVYIYVYIYRDWEGDRDTETESETKRDRYRDRETERDRERGERQRERQREMYCLSLVSTGDCWWPSVTTKSTIHQPQVTRNSRLHAVEQHDLVYSTATRFLRIVAHQSCHMRCLI